MNGIGTGILCPTCSGEVSSVKDSRVFLGGIRRRRLCPCGRRFTTIESVLPDAVQGDDDHGKPFLYAMATLGRMQGLSDKKKRVVLDLINALLGEEDIKPEEER